MAVLGMVKGIGTVSCCCCQEYRADSEEVMYPASLTKQATRVEITDISGTILSSFNQQLNAMAEAPDLAGELWSLFTRCLSCH